VLLTGATGFVGRHAPAALVARGYEVHAVARSPHAVGRTTDGVRWHAGDLLATNAAAALVEAVGPTHLLHLAWYVEHGLFWHSPENLRWVGATLELVRAFAEAGGGRAVLAGTCAEYAWGGEDPCREGVTPERPATLYGASKLAVRDVVDAFARGAGLSAAWGRLFLLYGPHEAPARLVPSVTRALLAGEEARCTHGDQWRDFLHARDAAAAFTALLDSGVEGAVNVASGEPVQIRDVVRTLAGLVNEPGLVRLGSVAAPAGDPPVLTAHVGRLRDEVGWTPQYSIRSGLADVVDWWAARAGTAAASATGRATAGTGVVGHPA
jgi:nucleoside-diphosphate-sugar epimerase